MSKAQVTISLEEYNLLQKRVKRFRAWERYEQERKKAENFERRLNMAMHQRDEYQSLAVERQQQINDLVAQVADLKSEHSVEKNRLVQELCDLKNNVNRNKRKSDYFEKMKYLVIRNHPLKGTPDPEHIAMFNDEADCMEWEERSPAGGRREYIG